MPFMSDSLENAFYIRAATVRERVSRRRRGDSQRVTRSLTVAARNGPAFPLAVVPNQRAGMADSCENGLPAGS